MTASFIPSSNVFPSNASLPPCNPNIFSQFLPCCRAVSHRKHLPSPREIEAQRHLAKHGRHPEEPPLALRARHGQVISTNTGVPIGTGDGFGQGTIAPRGLATEDGPAYKEYIEADDLKAQPHVATAMSKAMHTAGDQNADRFIPVQSADLYAISGGSADWFRGRYYSHTCGAGRINSLTVEFGIESGLSCPFYPINPQFHNSMRQVAAGLIEVALATAGKTAEPKIWKC